MREGIWVLFMNCIIKKYLNAYTIQAVIHAYIRISTVKHLWDVTNLQLSICNTPKIVMYANYTNLEKLCILEHLKQNGNQ